jgi:hypothetical protein
MEDNKKLTNIRDGSDPMVPDRIFEIEKFPPRFTPTGYGKDITPFTTKVVWDDNTHKPISSTDYFYNEKLDAYIRKDDEILTKMSKILEEKEQSIKELKDIIYDIQQGSCNNDDCHRTNDFPDYPCGYCSKCCNCGGHKTY